GAPELAGDDAALLRHGAARWPAAPGRRRRAGGPLHRRQVLLLQGLRHRRPGEPLQAWGAQLPGDNGADHLHGVVRHQPCHQGSRVRLRTDA
uniref:Uncharacterized protein n=1 Tax=Aegilops tauschii subsp. strangulata TaxID=200361 RepID=A0A453H6I8_AEGTS